MVTILIVVTLLSLALAGLASFVAWRTVRDARRRSEARITALARDIAGDDEPLDRYAPETARTPMFAEIQTVESRTPAPFAWAAGAIILGTSFALAVVLSGGWRPSAAETRNPVTVTATTPLELLALAHDRSAGALTIRGVVKNPTKGHDVNGLSAVVSLLGIDGRALGSGRGAVQDQELRADDQTSFLVTVPADASTARYRVGFEAGGKVVPHVDRRDVQ
jgi:hypothetical protein